MLVCGNVQLQHVSERELRARCRGEACQTVHAKVDQRAHVFVVAAYHADGVDERRGVDLVHHTVACALSYGCVNLHRDLVIRHPVHLHAAEIEKSLHALACIQGKSLV